MKITLNPDQDYLETTETNLSLLEEFFKSVGLENTVHWQELQPCILGEHPSPIEIFDMPVPIPAELFKEPEWHFGVYESSPGVQVFSINKRALAARLQPGSTFQQLTAVPREILCLAWTGYTYEDAPPLEGFSQLTTLSLADCCDLKNLSPLSGLQQLTTIRLIGCQSLQDLGPLAQLTQLTELAIIFSGFVADLGPLATLKNLTCLDLTLNSALEDLSPLATLDNLQTLELGGCNAVKNYEPLKNLPNLSVLGLKDPFLAEAENLGISECLGNDYHQTLHD